MSVPESPSSKIKEAQFQFGRIMREINQKIIAGGDFNSVLDFLYDSLNVIIPYDRIGIALIENDRLCSKWMKSKIPSGHLNVGYYGPLAGSSLNVILKTGQPRIINDLLQYSLEKPESESTRLALKDGIRSSLTCPIYSSGTPIGIVFFSSEKPDTYRTEHVETYLEIADELSFIVSQDRLRREAAAAQSASQNVRMLLHDLKSPLAVIQGFLELAQGDAWHESLEPDAKRIFETLNRNAIHMHDLLNELTELSHLNFQANTMEFHEVTLRDFVSDAATAGRDVLSKKSIELKVEYADDLPERVVFDSLKIRRAIDNFLSNAAKYSNRRTTVRLKVGVRDQRLHFDVIDEGLGVPEGEIKNLFREFGKTSVRPTEGESSSGIGLAIVRKIVELHAGQVYVTSQVGKGSAFGFWIPLRT